MYTRFPIGLLVSPKFTEMHRSIILLCPSSDFLHARESREAETTRVVAEWRRRHAHVAMVLVRGNHDARAGDPTPDIDITCVDAPVAEAPFVFTHKPAVSDSGYVLCGHIHPGARLTGPGLERARLPCFWFGKSCAVLPAFGEFTGLYLVEPAASDRVYVAVEDAVIQVGRN